MGLSLSFESRIMKALILLSLLAVAFADSDESNGVIQTVIDFFGSKGSAPIDEIMRSEDTENVNTTYLTRLGVREDCNCNADGSEDLACDAETGKCHCKCDVEGDKCDSCTEGHALFPDCHECNCNLEGATSFICDKSTAKCTCKS